MVTYASINLDNKPFMKSPVLERCLLVLLNFTGKTMTTYTGVDIRKTVMLIGNYEHLSKDGTLMPYEAVIYQLK